MASAIQIENWPNPRSLKLQKAKCIRFLFRKKKKPTWNIISIVTSVVASELVLNLTLVLSLAVQSWKLKMLTKCYFPWKLTLFQLHLCVSPLTFLCCKCVLRGLRISGGLFTGIIESLLCCCRVLELVFLYSAAALPLFSLFADDGDSKKSFVCIAGESVEHFKQLLFCHLYRAQQWCNCCNFHFHWLCCSECFPRWNSACLWSAQVALYMKAFVSHLVLSFHTAPKTQQTADCLFDVA